MNILNRTLSQMRTPMTQSRVNVAQQTPLFKAHELYQNYANSLLNKYGGQYGQVGMVTPQQTQQQGLFGFSEPKRFGFNFDRPDTGSA